MRAPVGFPFGVWMRGSPRGFERGPRAPFVVSRGMQGGKSKSPLAASFPTAFLRAQKSGAPGGNPSADKRRAGSWAAMPSSRHYIRRHEGMPAHGQKWCPRRVTSPDTAARRVVAPYKEGGREQTSGTEKEAEKEAHHKWNCIFPRSMLQYYDKSRETQENTPYE